MNAPAPSPPDQTPSDAPRRRPPLQYRLRDLLTLTAALSVVFGTLRWLGVSAATGAVVLVILLVSAAAAVGLLFVIASGDED
jgi:dolichyl-phosphate-mannose--protein O-mannosyl transferase